MRQEVLITKESAPVHQSFVDRFHVEVYGSEKSCEREFRTGGRVVSRTSPTFCATKVSSAVDLRLTTYEQTCIVHNRRYRRHGVHRFLPTTGNDGNLSHGTSSGPSLTDSAV